MQAKDMIIFSQLYLCFLQTPFSVVSGSQSSKLHTSTGFDELALIINKMVSDDISRNESDAAQELIHPGVLKAHEDVLDTTILDPERELGLFESYDETSTRLKMHHGAYGKKKHVSLETTMKPSDSHSGDMNMDSEGMMFHLGLREDILFSWWNCSSVITMTLSCIIVALLSILNEHLKFYNNYLQCSAFPKTHDNNALQDKFRVNEEDGKLVLRLQSSDDNIATKLPLTYGAMQLWRTVLYGTQIVVSCLLMLIFMTYNGWLWLAVLVGAAIGYSLISTF